jgi:hypothetical protein
MPANILVTGMARSYVRFNIVVINEHRNKLQKIRQDQTTRSQHE